MPKNKQVEGQLSFADLLVGDDALFEKEFALLTKLFDSVKTGDFDPMEYLSPIANAVKTMQGEGISFAEALERHCSKMSAEKIIAAFPADLQQKLVGIIGGMHDEI